jgi:hypothetical protein
MGQGDQAGWTEAVQLRTLRKEAGRATWGRKERGRLGRSGGREKNIEWARERKKNWAGRELSPGGLGKRNYFLLLFSNLLPNSN